MPNQTLPPPSWKAIYDAIQQAQSANQILQGMVADRDAVKRVIWVRELSTDPIPVVGQSQDLVYYSGKTRQVTKISPSVPEKGDIVLLLRSPNGSLRCIGVSQPAKEWTAPSPVGLLKPATVGLRELSPECFPSLIDVNVFMSPITHTNWNTNVVNTALIHNALRQSSGVQHDEIAFDLLIGAGTWMFELLHARFDNRGIYSVRFDGVEKGTIDGYAAVPQNNMLAAITNIVVPDNKLVRLSLKMASKHPFSSAYYGTIQHVQLRRSLVGGGPGGS